MPLSITGYVLDPPRVGSANSPFTATPNNYLSNPGAFNAAFPSNESVPRTEYHVFVLNDFEPPGTGPGGSRSFVDARFCWTKNEVIQRFDFEGQDGRFKTLPGSAPIEAGVLSSDSNTNRIKVQPPISTNLSAYPVRVSVGTGSGTNFTVNLVLNDGAFTTPALGAVQLSQATGNLNWNPTNLSSFSGQVVRFQRQTFYTFSESTGNLGIIDDVLLLNPLPASGQFPLIRIGFGEYLTPIQRASEAAFSANPTAGTVEWAQTTGRLKFNSGDVTANSSRNVYYDGSTFGFNLGIEVDTLGSIESPGAVSPLPPEASDLFFRISGVVQFPQVQYVDTLTTPGKKGVVQVRRSDGVVRFSEADKDLYPGQTVQAVIADLDIERGMTLRLFRSPVNLNAASSIKDVSAFYETTDALLADPIIGAPSVALPAVPVDTRPISVDVSQGTGSFVGNLPRLDVANPPGGLGYIIDFEQRELLFAQRKAGVVIPAPTPYGGVQLPDPLVFNSNLLLEIENTPGGGVYTQLVLGEGALIDYPSGLVTLTTTEGTLVVTDVGASFSGTTFTDASQNFSVAGVLPGDLLVILSGAAKGVYTIATVGTTTLTTSVAGVTASNISYEIRRGVEILADRYFYEVPPVDPNTRVERLRSLGTVTNSPRLTVDPLQASASRFRFGKTTFSSVVVQVANDGAFTTPASLPSGTVQISQATGNLNFSQTDVNAGGLVYWSKTLTLGTEYLIQPPLGFVQLSERMLELEEVFITYKNGDGDLVQERASFPVRKEVVQPHPVATSILSFNPLGREIAADPSPRAFRGGRPQGAGQVSFDLGASTVTFVGAPTVTDALPSGPTVAPTEKVLVDYNVHEAIGGEQSFTVLRPPVQSVPTVIQAGTDSFQIAGDRTTVFAANTLLLIDRTETYLVASSSYNSGTQLTTVTLVAPQEFRSDFQNPTLAVSSGPIRLTGSIVSPSYFMTELSSYDPVPRGATKFRIVGDVSRTYVSGTVVLFDGTDLNLVSGASYDETTGKTEVTLLTGGLRQYSSVSLKRSVRPVLASPSVSVSTSRSPQLEQTFLVFRRVEGQVGEILDQPDGYTIDGSGVVTLVDPLTVNEEVGILYTGATIIETGRRFRASYTFGIVPTDTNGLLNQILKIDYTTYIPDTFYWRVETFTNFRGELVEAYELEAQGGTPSGGPTLENSSTPRLFEQGKPSLFYEEGYLANEDLVARPTLKYFNDAVNLLEDVLQNMDGRVVGDHDGRFLFDGEIDNPARTTFAAVTNQIDDRFKVSPAPYTITGPPFVATSIGTFREVYKASATSRFYPTRRNRFGVTTSGSNTGDPIMDTGVENLRSASKIQRRFPWAVTTAKVSAGSTVLPVDDANGNTTLLRPSFANSMKVAIIAQNGSVLVSDASSMTVASFTSGTITLTGGVPVEIPAGSTVRLATNDTVYFKSYRVGVDLDVDLEKGLLTYIDPDESLLAWAGLTQTASPPGAGEVLDVYVALNNTSTEPERFPALDGSTLDDDSNRQFPILTPSSDSEIATPGHLKTELRLIETGTGSIRLATSEPFLGIGSLDGTGTVITKVGGAWSSPTPKVYDLVNIRTGPNSPSSFRLITAVGATTITVNSAYPVPGDTGFTFSVTTNSSLYTGTAGGGSTSSTISDASANYTADNVLPGHTVVINTGIHAGLRRQIIAVTSPTTIQFVAFPSSVAGADYRIDNCLQTFGGVPSSLREDWEDAVDGERGVLEINTDPFGEILAIDQFFDTVFNDVATGSNGVTTGAVLSAAGETFLSSGVNTSHLVFIRSGTLAGFYAIQDVTSETTLEIDGTFPANLSGVSFRIVKSLGLTPEPLNKLLQVALNAETFLDDTNDFRATLITVVAVVGDVGAYATRIVTSDVNAREASVNARINQVEDDIPSVEEELSSGDRLYDQRYVWIDTRINLEYGILVSKDRAVKNRIKAQADALKKMTKLLAVQQM